VDGGLASLVDILAIGGLVSFEGSLEGESLVSFGGFELDD
jgi:hypothetical protein